MYLRQLPNLYVYINIV